MRMPRSQRQDAIEEPILKPFEGPEYATTTLYLKKESELQPVIEVTKEPKEGDPEIETIPLHPYPLFSGGDRFVSSLTGLKVELIEHTEYKEEKGWKCNVKVLACGENDHHKRGELTSTYEATLASDFEQITSNEPIEEKKSRRTKAVEATPSTPKVILPQTYSNAPWAEWPLPSLSGGVLQDFLVKELMSTLLLVQKSTGEVLGELTPTAVDELGKRAQFPPDFVVKLSPAIAAAVINDRIEKAKAETFQIVFEDCKFSNILPSWRGILPTKQVAELVYQQLKAWYPDIEIDIAQHENGSARLRFLTPVVYPVTGVANDALRLGIDVTHQYGDTLRVALFTRRTASGGGMLSFCSEYSWRKRTGEAGSADSQAYWLGEEVTRAVCGFTSLIEKAKLMAETRLIGDSDLILKDRASSVGITRNKVSLLIESARGEDTQSEWDWACRVSKYATLVEKEPDLSRRVMLAIGNCVETFEPGKDFSGLVGVTEEDE